MPKGYPTYQQVDPATGAVTNEFEGSIKAEGIVLPPGDGDADPSTFHRVMWVREADGARVAQVYTVNTPDHIVASIDETSARYNPTGVAQKRINALGPNLRSAGLLLETMAGANASYVQASAADTDTADSAIILNSNSQSNFVRLQGARRTKLTGPYVVGFNIAPNTHVQWNFGVPDRTGWGNTQIIGSIENSGGWSQYFLWTYIWVNNSTIQIQSTNSNGSVVVNGYFRFMVLYID